MSNIPLKFLTVALAATLMTSAVSAAPVEAQETTTTSVAPTTSTPTDTAAPTTAVPTTAPSDTPAPTTEGSSAANPGSSVPPVAQPDGSDGSSPGELGDDEVSEELSSTDDLAAHEESYEEPPEVDITVPPPDEDTYNGQGGYAPEQVLISSVAEARVKLVTAKTEHVNAVSVVKSLRLRLKRLENERELLDGETQANLGALGDAEIRLRARALSAFVRGGTMTVGSAVDPDGALEFLAQQTIADVVFEGDDALIATYQSTRAQLDRDALSLFDRIRVITDALAGAQVDVAAEAIKIEQASRELEAFEAGSQIYISGVVFPIQWPYDLPLIDSWGFPRMTGSADEHWHEGIDLFAPAGTPLLATERGIVTRIGSGRLGGLRLWLRGESGTDWYYAHLSAFAEDLTEGQVVAVGDVIGYVGNTGNAVGTPPHLHMQVHPNGGEPVNPYPLMFVVSEREKADRAAGPAASSTVGGAGANNLGPTAGNDLGPTTGNDTPTQLD